MHATSNPFERCESLKLDCLLVLGIGELLDALCVKTDNADPEDDNACTRAMKYAGCTPDRLREACIASPATPGCASCVEEDVSAEHSAFQQLSDRHLGQGICMTAGRYGEAMPCPSSSS